MTAKKQRLRRGNRAELEPVADGVFGVSRNRVDSQKPPGDARPVVFNREGRVVHGLWLRTPRTRRAYCFDSVRVFVSRGVVEVGKLSLFRNRVDDNETQGAVHLYCVRRLSVRREGNDVHVLVAVILRVSGTEVAFVVKTRPLDFVKTKPAQRFYFHFQTGSHLTRSVVKRGVGVKVWRPRVGTPGSAQLEVFAPRGVD